MKLWVVVAVAMLSVSAARGDVLLHRQAPGRTFGITSDTLYRDDSGQPSGALVADRFALATQGDVCRIVWWSFYGSSLDQQVEPPPASETIRVRFYEDLAGLPGSLLSEQLLIDPARIPTGFAIPIGAGPPEFRYDTYLPDCVSVQRNTTYWLEISQLDSLESRFRWEHSNTPDGFAVKFPLDTPWRLSSNPTQLAYELWTPEPGSGVLVGLVGLMLRRWGKCA